MSTVSKIKKIKNTAFWSLLGDLQHATQIGVASVISRRYPHKYYLKQTATGDAHAINNSLLPGLQILPVLIFARISLHQLESLIIGDNGIEQRNAQQQ